MGVNSESRAVWPVLRVEKAGDPPQEGGEAAMAVGAKIPGVPTSVGGRQVSETTVPVRVGSHRIL